MVVIAMSQTDHGLTIAKTSNIVKTNLRNEFAARMDAANE
jgi:hypothetical protein